MIAFGPVPSRRLGRSLGINNIPPKVCSYSCVYCQLGRTQTMQVERRSFYDPEVVFQQVRDKVNESQDIGEPIDYLTFVPDGEPTLDLNLEREIELLRPLGLKIAVITNASLIWRDDVRQDLMKADWVSLKVDSTDEALWRKIDRPHGIVQMELLLDGMVEFAGDFSGALATETMLIEGLNDGQRELETTGDFLGKLKPSTAYLAIPTRPPAEKWVRPPDEGTVNRAYQILSGSVEKVAYLIGYEGDAFALTGEIEKDLLSITAVHPMRESAVTELLTRAGKSWSVVHQLISRGQLVEVEYEGNKFYLRSLRPVVYT